MRLHHATAGLLGLPSETIAWMLKMLAPYAEAVGDCTDIDVIVEVVDTLPVTPRVGASGWPTTSGVTAGFDAELGKVFVRADVSKEAHRIAILQTVRGLLADRLLRGSMPLHAAVVSIRGRGVVLAGPKGAGKTSFTTALLRAEPQSRLVTNDKAFVMDGVVHGLPFAVLVGHEGLRRTGELSGVGRRTTTDKIAVWPEDFARSLGREVATTVVPEVGIWCDARFDMDTLSIGPLEPAIVNGPVADALTDFSQAMIPVHLSGALHQPTFPPAMPSSWVASLPWLHARGNPWMLGSDHLHAIAVPAHEMVGS